VQSNRSGIGARVRVVTGERAQIQDGSFPANRQGFRIEAPVNVHFGLGAFEHADTLEIRWPSGICDRLLDVPADQLVTIHEGDAPMAIKETAGAPLPATFALSESCPNPFNPSTAITYDLPEARYVQLEIYNITGQRVAALVSEHQEPGRYTVRWHAGESGSGVYFCRLKAGRFQETRRMVHLK
jgi:hypothetical protein